MNTATATAHTGAPAPFVEPFRPNDFSSKNSRLLLAGCALFVVLLGGLVLYDQAKPDANAIKVSNKSGQVDTAVAATVDSQRITRAEISGMVGAGLDPAVALDRQINRAVAAKLARAKFPEEAEAAAAGAERDVLSQLFIARRSQEISNALTPAEIKSFYETNVTDAAFNGYKVSAFVTQDRQEADRVAAAIAAGQVAEHAARFKPLKMNLPGKEPAKDQTQADALTAPQLPYGLGNVAQQLKPGQYSRPLVIRDGVVMIRLDGINPQAKPPLEELTPQIKELLVAQRLGEELNKARASATIALK